MLSPLLLLPLLAIIILNLPIRSLTQKLAVWVGVGLSLWQIVAVILLATGQESAAVKAVTARWMECY